jgi:hypothetical protein
MPYADREKQRAAVKRLDAARYLLKKEEMLEKARAWKAANSEHVKTYHREWLAANRPKANASGSRRRALEKDSTFICLKLSRRKEENTFYSRT